MGELYRLFSRRLLRIVRWNVRAPDAVIEDACQFAWARLVHHGDRVQRETALGWLIKTAVREALRAARRAERELSLESALDQGADFPLARERAPQALAEERDRLRSLASLPPRQQRVLWLRGVGLSYGEIAREQGCTSRTIERQLYQARTKLRADDACSASATR